MLAKLGAFNRYIGSDPKDVDDESLRATLLTVASDCLEAYCGRNFTLREVSDHLDGADTRELVLSHWPVTEVFSVHVLTETGFSRLPQEDFTLRSDSGIIENTKDVFARGHKNIRIHYHAGYTTIPDDLASACVKLAAQMYIVSDLSADVEALVAPYRERT